MAGTLIAFLARYLGALGTGTTPENTGQCVGLVERWLAALGVGPIWGDAKDLLANADPRWYTVERNAPDNYPPPGAVVCWNASWGAGHGHTAVVLAATRLHMAVFEQNDPTGALPLAATHGYAGVQGWLTVKAPKVTA